MRAKPRLSCKAKALSYLARREHSKLELSAKLFRAGYSEEEVQEALAAVDSYGWQSDERFAEHLARRRSGNYGKRLISAELNQHDISAQALSDALNSLEHDTERALRWIEKRYGDYIPLDEKMADAERSAKLFKRLMARGFGPDDVKKAIRQWKEKPYT